MILADRDTIYEELGRRFRTFELGLSNPYQRTHLDGVLWDLAGELARPDSGQLPGNEAAARLFKSYFVVDEKAVADAIDEAVKKERDASTQSI